MASCTFFGHKEIHFEKLTDNLIFILTNLIVNKEVDTFFVGNQGDFDKTVLCVLRKLKSQFRHIKFSVVLAYHPSLCKYSDYISSDETIFPEELYAVHPKFAISKRNEWMISKSDFAVVFVQHPTGGAAKYRNLAEKKMLTVINIYDSDESKPV